MAETSPKAPLVEEPDEPQPIIDADEREEDELQDESPDERYAREAMELAHIRSTYSRASRQVALSTASSKPSTFLGHLTYNLSKFWRHQISIVVPHSTCRDHLALERTFLAYLRTSLALSMMGIVVVQLFRLNHNPKPSPIFGFYVLGKPLSCICQSAAIYTLMVGAFRTWRSQNAIVRGKAISGGYEILMIAGGIFAILLMFFVLLVAVDVDKEDVNAG